MNQDPACAQNSKPIAADLAQLARTWQAVPIASALMEVGVPQLITKDDGSGVDVVQIGRQAKVDTELLYRYMRFLSTLGIFKELPQRHFAHNESSKMLLPGHPTFYYLLIHGSAKGGMMTAAEFVTQLKDPSKSAFEHALKITFWEHIAQTPELEEHFADFMTLLSNQMMPDILKNIKLPDTGIVADVGGGKGHDLLEFLQANPKLTGIVYELPTLAKLIKKGLQDPNPPNDSIYSKYPIEVKKRVSVVEGSYTDSSQLKQLANADMFYFKWILHDNSDVVCRKILAGIYQVMKSTAKIIICDFVLEHTLNEWKSAITADVLVSMSVNGKERTKNEWIQLLSDGDGYQYNVSFGDCTIGQQIWEMKLITATKC